MDQPLQLYILLITDSSGRPRAIPFFWDGSGSEDQAAGRVTREKGAAVLAGEEADLSAGPDEIMEMSISGPWSFDELPLVHQGEGVPTISVPFSLNEKYPEAEQPRRITGTLHLYVNHDVGVHFDGYQAPDSDAPDAETVALELWNGDLRVLAWPDPSNIEPLIVEMEGARDSG